MNLAYVHLITNHIPVFGTVFGICFLTYATLRRHETLFRASLWTFLIVGLFTIPVYFTGDPAEHIVKSYPGLDIDRKAIEQHSDAALFAFIALGILALFALVLLLKYRFAETTPRPAVLVTLVLAVVAFGLVAYAAKLGGEIHHPEVRAGLTAPTPGGGER